MRIVLGADTAALVRDRESFIRGDAASLLGEELLCVLKSADIRIFDIEAPLTDASTPIKKHGPVLGAPSETAAGFRKLPADAVTMANNHIMDHGREGFYSTVKALDGVGVAHFGAGEDPASAANPFIAENGGVRIGFIGCAEHEFSIVTESEPGANPFDSISTPKQTAALKAVCDRVVVLYHGGRERYRYPSPGLMRNCRMLTEAGADAVICQHSHCIGCMEEYNGSIIVYGQGNFIFDRPGDPSYEGMLIVLEADKEGLSAEFVPYRRSEVGVRALKGGDAERILEAFRSRSEEIKSPGRVEELFSEVSRRSFADYYKLISGRGNGFAYRALNKLTKGGLDRRLLKKRADEKTMLAWKNYFEDEAHRESILRAVSDRLSDGK